MEAIYKHIVPSGVKIKEALQALNILAKDSILFVTKDNKLIGSLTDGDIRRGLINGFTIEDEIDDIIQSSFKYVYNHKIDVSEIISLRENNFRIIPVVNKNKEIIDIINFRLKKSYLPIDVVIMAGGKGTRLKPLTDNTPKPLLPVGSKPIIEHNIDRLALFGIKNYWLSVNYLGDQIENYFNDKLYQDRIINYVWENTPMGTIGAVSKINSFLNKYVLITNSDLLTTLNYEDFFLKFIESDADLSVLSIPYSVNIPYAVLETKDNKITGFKEKPTYTYHSNGGVYLMKRKLIELIPKESFFNATDLIEEAVRKGLRVTSYPFKGYWLDVGQHEDYERANEEISQLNLK